MSAGDIEPPGRRRLGADAAGRGLFWFALVLFLAYLFLKAVAQLHDDPARGVPGVEATVFWAAAKLALAGQALSVFDPGALSLAAGFTGAAEGVYLWLYPPGYLLLVLPMGLVSPAVAWLGFVLVSSACFALALRGPARGLAGGWQLYWASPVVFFWCLALGQNSVLWTAGLVAALWAMHDRRPVLAGFWIAVLTLKPHLGLLIPVALIAARQWRIIGWAGFWSAAVVLVSTAVFGVDYWLHFLGGLSGAREGMGEQTFAIERMTSFYAMARNLGADDATAFRVYLVGAAAVAALTAWVWSRPGVSEDARHALLCAGIPLMTPYGFYYDMVTVLVAAMYLRRDGFGRGAVQWLWLAAIWLGPSVALLVPSVIADPPAAASVSVTSTAMMAAMVAVCAAWGLARAPGGRAAASSGG